MGVPHPSGALAPLGAKTSVPINSINTSNVLSPTSSALNTSINTSNSLSTSTPTSSAPPSAFGFSTGLQTLATSMRPRTLPPPFYSPHATASQSGGVDSDPSSVTPPFRLLSPLLFPRTSQSPVSPSSPTSTLVGGESVFPDESASTEVRASASGSKRKAAQTEFETDLGTRRTSKRLCAAAQLAGASVGASRPSGDHDDYVADESDDVADTPDARRPQLRGGGRTKSPCPCGGNRARLACPAGMQAAASTIGEIQQQLEQELNGEAGDEQEEGAFGEDNIDVDELDSRGRPKAKGKMKKPPTEKWNTKGPPPTLSSQTSPPIVWLSYVTTSPEIQQKLVDLLLSLSMSPTGPPATSSPFSPTPTINELAMRCSALENMAILNDFLQMMSYVHLALHVEWRRKQSGRKGTDFRAMAAECGEEVNQRRLQKWFTAGSRLIYLCGASSLYLIPMFAAAGMKSDICFKYSCRQIQVLAFVLCNPVCVFYSLSLVLPKLKPLHLADDGTHSLTVSCGKLIRTVVVPQMALIKQLSSALNATAFKLSFFGTPTEDLPFCDLDVLPLRLRAFKANFYALPPADVVWEVLASDMLSPGLAPVLAPLKIDSSCVAEEIKIITSLLLDPTVCPVTKENLEAWTRVQRAFALCAQEATSIDDLKNKLAKLHTGGVKQKDTYETTNLLETLPHLQTTLLTQLASIMAGEVYSDKSEREGFSFLAWHCSYYNRYAEKGHDAPKDVHPNYVHKTDKTRANFTQRTPHVSKEVEDNPAEAAMLAEMIHLITIIVEYHVKHFLPEDYEEIKVYVSQLPLNDRSLRIRHQCLRLSLVLHSDKYGDQWVRDGNGWLPNDDEYLSGKED
ncbi:hypothetical protein DFH09DRAFT_1082892 [Mycena vulgaris]|nr:hypothetical protein DFH09DRAFT_1082892 [Mycena vulgaris]